MFAGYGSYAGSFSPGAPPGMMNYGEPSSQQGPYGGAYPTFPSSQYEAGHHILGGLHAGLPAAIGAATFAGSFLPGFVGTTIGRMDPFQAALGGFGRASGVSRGIAGMGVMDSIGTMGSNIGRIGAGGVGNVFRAGLAGVGGAAAAAFLPLAGLAAVQHATGQMAQGAQFTGQVQQTLGQNFRFVNPQSQTGYGFSREQGAEIADTVRTMGNKDIMSSPQEMLRIMNQSIQGGLFRPVQDAKAFQEKFKEVVSAVKEIAKTFNTTLEGAMPFLQEGRRMGFWTPADIQRMAGSTLGTAKITGMSVAQVQQMQQQGADMARQVGAVGTTGAKGMTGSLGLVGGAIRNGSLSEQALSDMTGGLTGSDAIQAFAGQLQASATRFSASGTGRWLLAGLAGKDMKHLDKGKLAMLASGQIGVGSLRGMAEKNVNGRGAAFRMGEEEMRGDLLEMGFEGQAGFLKGLVGDRLYGDSDMDKYVTRRLIQRFTGGDAKSADAKAKMLRNLQQTLRENRQNSESMFDQKERDQKELMDHSYEGLKRKISLWWKSNVDDPLQKVGSDVSEHIGDAIESFSDRLWGRSPRALRNMGITSGMAKASRAGALGDLSTMRSQFASDGEMESRYGKPRAGTVRERIMASGESQVTKERMSSNYGVLDATSGFMNDERAGALGYSNAGVAGKGLETLGEAWNTAGVLGAVTDSKFSDPFARANEGVNFILNNPKISPEIKAQLEGIPVLQRAGRLIAAAPGEGFRQRAGISNAEEAENTRIAVGLGKGGDGNLTEEGVKKNWDSAVTDLFSNTKGTEGAGGIESYASTSGKNAIGGVDVLQKLMTGEDGEEFKKALALQAHSDPRKVDEGRNIFAKLATKYYEKDPGKASMLKAWSEGKDSKKVAKLGESQREFNAIHRTETFQNRLSQVKSSLESHGDYTAITEGLKDAGLEGIASLISKGGSKDLSGDAIVSQAMAAVEGTKDPLQLARAAAMLKQSGTQGAGFLIEAIEGQQQKLGLNKAFTGGTDIKAEVNALSGLGQSLMGRGFSPNELRAVHGAKGNEFIDQLVTDEQKSGSIRGSQEAALVKKLLKGVRAGGKGAGEIYSVQDAVNRSNVEGALGGGTEGRRAIADMGTLPGIHTTLKEINTTLKDIRDSKSGGSSTDAPKKMDKGYFYE
ncbi:hypothetical protein UFOVP276_146 [uncultured Caudovirales phage]|uniref:Uncharacterized protein n=1 Tax=uncultured Caudovirales phage TaxID=2100421 RepID=A0A6J5LQA3_9CAUD|nr:hypothetical protein UFOVP127_40 [uncultured Caudovirales phage]CAB4135190.1 hypothetical protein UFOVP276_146 [uncultured Caudovirales phage]